MKLGFFFVNIKFWYYFTYLLPWTLTFHTKECLWCLKFCPTSLYPSFMLIWNWRTFKIIYVFVLKLVSLRKVKFRATSSVNELYKQWNKWKCRSISSRDKAKILNNYNDKLWFSKAQLDPNSTLVLLINRNWNATQISQN